MFQGFITTYDNIKNSLISEATVYVGAKTEKAVALWDTGATGTNISKGLVQKLQPVLTGYVWCHGVGGANQYNTYIVDIELPNGVYIKNVQVIESEIGEQGLDLLIGMDIISQGDFAVSNYDGKTKFMFSQPSQKHVDDED